MTARSWFAVAAAAALFASGCSKPKPPQITPRSAHVTNVSLLGIDFEAQLVAYNPNDMDLDIKSVTGKVVLDHKYDVGTFTESKPITLPAHKRTNVTVPVKVRWADVMGLADLAGSNRSIDYLIDGSVELGGDLLRVNVPFQVNGTVTHAQMEKAAGSVIPRIPGITIPGIGQ